MKRARDALQRFATFTQNRWWPWRATAGDGDGKVHEGAKDNVKVNGNDASPARAAARNGSPELAGRDFHGELARRIAAREAKVGVIGLGYVGLPLSHALHDGGLFVTGFDVDGNKIDDLANGRCYLDHFGEKKVEELTGSDRFDATDDFRRLAEMDAVLVCVPTPLGAHGEPDLRFVVDSARRCGEALRPGQLLVLESTTYPGTTRDVFLPAVLEACSWSPRLGRDLFMAYSPEREDPSNSKHTTRTIPTLVGGLDPRSAGLADALYGHGVESVVLVRSAEIAESAKLLENIFRSVNIALVNELKGILDAMGIDIWEVVEAASTKPFGFMPFYPGPGLGGHCIPIDPFYLAWKAREVGCRSRFIELAGEINTVMPDHVLRRTIFALNEEGVAARGARVLVLGLAYKPDVDDTRESPAFELISGLAQLGARVDYHDPLIPVTKFVRRHELKMESVPLTPDVISTYDAVLVATDHSNVDYELVGRHAKLVIDTRNAFASRGVRVEGRLVKA